MLNQFRVRYPKGSLIGELLTIDRSQYIVRCLVQVEGTTLATGLAAAETIELAEDKARNRALAALGIDPTAVNGSLKSSITPHPQEVSVLPQPTPAVATAFSSERLEPTPAQDVSSTPSTSSVTSTPKSESKRKKKTTPVVTSPEESEEISVTDEFSVPEIKPLPDEVETPMMVEETDFFEPSPDVTPAPSFSESESDTDIRSQPTPENPVDFSEIIARTNVELKRLGWTQQQGRDYLVQTYGKRSRQLLTDEELLDFLHHLEAEPTPD